MMQCFEKFENAIIIIDIKDGIRIKISKYIMFPCFGFLNLYTNEAKRGPNFQVTSRSCLVATGEGAMSYIKRPHAVKTT